MNRFVVFEGLDGAGKSTQIEMIKKHFADIGVRFMYLHFPRAGESVIGEMIAKFLRGGFGKIGDINPYFVALMYAQDRNEAKQFVLDCIHNNEFLIVDRYVYSNIAYQCAKINQEIHKEELRDWILKLEYENNAIPKPDITIYLKVPFDFVKETLTNNREGEGRQYLKGNKDIHENDLKFQKNVDIEYLKMAEIDPNFRVVDCCNEEGRLLSPRDINNKIIRSIDDA